jgi:hypothetical protein
MIVFTENNKIREFLPNHCINGSLGFGLLLLVYTYNMDESVWMNEAENRDSLSGRGFLEVYDFR